MVAWIAVVVAFGAAPDGFADGGQALAPRPLLIETVNATAQVEAQPADAGVLPAPMMFVGPPEADAGYTEEVILLIPAKRPPPPPPEPPKQLTVTVKHDPRPKYEWGQAALELGVATGVNVVGSAALFAVKLIPIIISDLFGAPGVGNGFLYVLSLTDAFILPLAGTMAIERVKAYSRHYQLEGLSWWATLGSGVALQLTSTIITYATVNVSNLLTSPHLLVYAFLTPAAQTVVANAMATPRDPLAPLEAAAPRQIYDAYGRRVPTFTLLSGSF